MLCVHKCRSLKGNLAFTGPDGYQIIKYSWFLNSTVVTKFRTGNFLMLCSQPSKNVEFSVILISSQKDLAFSVIIAPVIGFSFRMHWCKPLLWYLVKLPQYLEFWIISTWIKGVWPFVCVCVCNLFIYPCSPLYFINIYHKQKLPLCLGYGWFLCQYQKYTLTVKNQ